MNYRKAITISLYVVIAFSFKKASSQLCQGSLGDPVVNINFGAGTNPGAPLLAAVNSYNYVSHGCPMDGSYTVANSVTACFRAWNVIPEDHTPDDINGYMMVVNASYSPGDFYLQTVSGLCSGTTYEFASWILNIQDGASCGGNPIQPNVTLSIETDSGAVLMVYNTGNIPFGSNTSWNQYGSFFTTPPGISSVVIRITNNAPGGCGNDVALDDITFRPCGPLVSATINGSDTRRDICEGSNSSFRLAATITNSNNNQRHQWQISTSNGASWNDIIGATNITYTTPAASPAGVYKYRLAVGQGSNITLSSCRIVSNVVEINVNAPPVPAASSDGPKCEAESITLTASNGSVYNWSGPRNFTSTSQSPVIINATLADTGKYYVTIATAIGCTNTDSTVVSILKRPVVHAGNDTAMCEGANVMLQAVATNSIFYSWSPAISLSNAKIINPVARPVDTTMYVLTASNNTCSNADTIMINIWKKPVASAGPDVRINEGQSVMLKGSVTGNNTSYYWTPNHNIFSSSSLQPLITPVNDTTYTLHVISNNGCGSAADNVFVRVFKKVTVPNAFSPNEDGINDRWNITALSSYRAAEVSVFNRYGQPVFYSKGYAKPWDGSHNSTLLPAGTYYYLIDLKEGMPLLSGWLMLLK